MKSFRQPETVDEPPVVRGCFEQEVEEVSTFLERIKGMPARLRERERLRKVAKSLSNSYVVGMYSRFHDNAVYSLGYSHAETIRLAYM